jgi:hypothetical protein
MESRSYMFSTAKKRSTLLENKGIEYPRKYVDSHERTKELHACLSSKKNVLLNMMPSWHVSKLTPENPKIALPSVSLFSNAEKEASKKQILTRTILIDQEVNINLINKYFLFSHILLMNQLQRLSFQYYIFC